MPIANKDVSFILQHLSSLSVCSATLEMPYAGEQPHITVCNGSARAFQADISSFCLWLEACTACQEPLQLHMCTATFITSVIR